MLHCVAADAHMLPAFTTAVPTCCPARRAACASRSSSMTAAIPTAPVSNASPARQHTTLLVEPAAQRAGCRVHPLRPYEWTGLPQEPGTLDADSSD